MESLLFGHEQGAFTGAHRVRLGAVRRAEGGTLILRGIDELDRTLQVKLLRLLQERVVEPLGSEMSVPVDVRVITTASSTLPDRVSRGEFREDLYYRLAVVVLEVPPLRTRLEGMSQWVEPLIELAAQRVGRPYRPLSSEAVERLCDHSWPGNVRELENALERTLVLGGKEADGRAIEAAELDFLPEAAIADEALRDLARQGLALGVPADRWEGALLEQAIHDHRGRVAAAARALGLTRKAFEYRLQRFRSGQAEEDEG